ncbi:MAG TPA: hypothetical protein PKA03_07240 [Tabrizicola sp.]|nr:hypothetical protein [Tabrizicola sp.]
MSARLAAPDVAAGPDSPGPAAAQPVALRRNTEDRPAGDRQREGARLTDVHGLFELTGDRVAFFPGAGRESYRLLENLALERVAQVISESRTRQEWMVSGTLTEFRGANYLLLTKAVIKSSTPEK